MPRLITFHKSTSRVNSTAVYRGSESSQNASKISCVLKMNEGLAGLKLHEGE